jgi:two-component system sensor histidine kinase RpfC
MAPDTRPAGLENLPGGRNVVVEWPLDAELLRSALRSVMAEEDGKSDVVFLSEYLKRRDSGRALRILVADDTASNRTVINKILERAGHGVELVETGEQVLDALDRDRYDVVIVDRNMPEVSGLDALKRIRFMYPGRDRIPVIVLSADVTPETRDESMEAGADAFLPKPVEAARLLDLIAELSNRVLPEPRPEVAAAPPQMPAQPARRPLSAVESPVLNAETIGLLEELGRDGDFMEKLVQALIGDTQSLLRRLENPSQVSPGDLRAVVHALKGSVSSVGADRLTACCTRIAAMSDPALKSEAGAVVRALRDEFDAVGRALADYLSKRKRSGR